MMASEKISARVDRWRDWAWIEQAARFVIVGLANTALDLGLYYFLTHRMGIFSDLNVLAKAISYGVGVVNSYWWNRSWTFQSSDRSGKTFLPFVFTNLAGLAINAGLLWLAQSILSVPEVLALSVATGGAFVWNFGVNKLLVFRE